MSLFSEGLERLRGAWVGGKPTSETGGRGKPNSETGGI